MALKGTAIDKDWDGCGLLTSIPPDWAAHLMACFSAMNGSHSMASSVVESPSTHASIPAQRIESCLVDKERHLVSMNESYAGREYGK